MEHPPLTAKQIEILNQIPAEGIELSNAEQAARGWQDLGYLGQAGYLTNIQTRTDADMTKWAWRWTRTDKPLA